MTTAPAELTAYDQWVCWHYGSRPDGKGTTKIPIDPKTGENAKPNDPGTWSSFDCARDYCSGHVETIAGIGFMFSAQDPFVGIDLDHCIQGGEVAPWAMEVVSSLSSYTERSPSRTGLHIYCRGVLPTGGNRKGDYEFYDRGRYLTITGDRLEGTPDTIEERSREIAAIHAKVFAACTGKSSPPHRERRESSRRQVLPA